MWRTRVQEVMRRYEALEERLADPNVLGDPERLRAYAREHAELAPVVETAEAWRRAESELESARELADTSGDPELAELARLEVAELEAKVGELESRLRRQLLPKDPLADRSAVVEIRAGTGGAEAGLFAGDLF